MKNLPLNKIARCLAFVCSLAASALVANGQTNFAVSNTGFQYFINGTNGTGQPAGDAINNCPPIFVTAGTTNTFTISVDSIHPMKIVTNSPGPGATGYSGASPQGVVSGTMTLIIPPANFPTTLYYECANHFFYGIINIVPPSATAPPPNQIISIVVTPTGVVVTSSGTNTTYALVPQFNSNLVNGNWQDVPAFTNHFTNSVNTTSFNRLDEFCGSNVFVRITQRPP